MTRWRIAQAKERFSEVLRKAAQEPQLILHRDRPVAVVVDAEQYRDFEAWRQQRRRPSMADAIAELRRICTAERYELEIPARGDRRNEFVEALDELPV